MSEVKWRKKAKPTLLDYLTDADDWNISLPPSTTADSATEGLTIESLKGAFKELEALRQKDLARQQIALATLGGQVPAPLGTLLTSSHFNYVFNNAMWNTTTTAPPMQMAIERKDLPKATILGPLIAYRSWGIKLGSGRLWSTGIGNNAWPFVPVRSECKSNNHLGHVNPPFAGCSCGWYGMKSEKDIFEGYASSADCVIKGKVALWGRVIEHWGEDVKEDLGYRAEFAHPIEIWIPESPMPGFVLPPNVQKELEAISANYGCEIVEEKVNFPLDSSSDSV